MKKLMYVAVLLFAACKSPQEQMRPNKAAIIKSMIYDFYNIHFAIKTPPGHPEKIEELIIKGWNGPEDTIKRKYSYKNDKLTRVLDEQGKYTSEYLFKYDEEDRCILIEERTYPNGPFREHTVKYKKKVDPRDYSDYDVTWNYSIDGDLEDINCFKYCGNADSFLINMGSSGWEKCKLRESNDTTYVDKTWYSGKKALVIDHQIIAYDKNYRQISATSFNKDSVDRVLKLTYDKYGNELSWITEDADNAVGSNGIIAVGGGNDAYYSTYEYDSKGNWTTKKKKNGYGNFRETATRKITYAK